MTVKSRRGALPIEIFAESLAGEPSPPRLLARAAFDPRNFRFPIRHNSYMSQNRMSRRAIQVVAENRIREAIEEGQFDNLPGLGQPIADIDEPYDPDWWIKKWIRREGMSKALAERFGKDFWARK